MALLDLTSDELLSTTRAVRFRLDLTRPVEHELLRECVELAVQAPTGRNRQRWHFVVVTDREQRRRLGDLFRLALDAPRGGSPLYAEEVEHWHRSAEDRGRAMDGLAYLYEHIHEVPAFVVPCIIGRTDGADVLEQAGTWGSILPAVWSFMLAARARGLGTCWTTVNLQYEAEFADVLGIPFDRAMQAAFIPVAHTIGTGFRPGPRRPLEEIAHWDRW